MIQKSTVFHLKNMVVSFEIGELVCEISDRTGQGKDPPNRSASAVETALILVPFEPRAKLVVSDCHRTIPIHVNAANMRIPHEKMKTILWPKHKHFLLS